MAVAIGLRDAGKRRDGRFERGSVPDANRRSSESAWTKAITQAGVVLDHRPGRAGNVSGVGAWLFPEQVGDGDAERGGELDQVLV